MNPRDIMTDAIHNFHPQYQQYTQYSNTGSGKVGLSLYSISGPELILDLIELNSDNLYAKPSWPEVPAKTLVLTGPIAMTMTRSFYNFSSNRNANFFNFYIYSVEW